MNFKEFAKLPYQETIDMLDRLTEEGVLKPKVVDGTTYPPTMEDLVTHVRQSDRDMTLKKATGKKMGGYIKKYANGGGVRKVRE